MSSIGSFYFEVFGQVIEVDGSFVDFDRIKQFTYTRMIAFDPSQKGQNLPSGNAKSKQILVILALNKNEDLLIYTRSVKILLMIVFNFCILLSVRRNSRLLLYMYKELLIVSETKIMLFYRF